MTKSAIQLPKLVFCWNYFYSFKKKSFWEQKAVLGGTCSQPLGPMRHSTRQPTSETAQGVAKYFLQNDIFVWCDDFKTCLLRCTLLLANNEGFFRTGTQIFVYDLYDVKWKWPFNYFLCFFSLLPIALSMSSTVFHKLAVLCQHLSHKPILWSRRQILWWYLWWVFFSFRTGIAALGQWDTAIGQLQNKCVFFIISVRH